MPTVNNNKPTLRFPEFKGEWENKKLGELVKINQGLQIAITERYTEQVKGSHFYITNEFLKANSEKKYFIKNPTQSVLCTKDDILMTRTGNTGMVVTNVEGAFHNNFFKVAYPEHLNKDYLYNFLKLEKTQNLIKKLAGTSTIPDLNHSDFYRIQMSYPILLEQQKIATFLTAVEDKLQALKQKKSLLEQYKKGVMQKIFTQELRFKDDNGNAFADWEEKKLGEVGEIVTGKTPSTNDARLWNGNIHFVTPTDIDENKYQKKAIRTVTANTKLKILPLKSIMFTCIASIGKMSLSMYPCITNQQINSIIPNETFDNEFIYYALLNIVDYIKSTPSSSTLPIINKTEFSKFSIKVACLAEQTKIATFLSTIDEKINQCQAQITNTAVWKKGLLQGMFC